MSNSMIEKVNALIAAPSCCAELRAVAEEWLKAVGTEGEKEASAKLIAELEEELRWRKFPDEKPTEEMED